LIVRHDGGALRVETFNDGAAFSGEQLEHLFEPFGVGGESGQSLGLWVTYQIVRQLGGSIRHRSAEGLTRFEVDLPVGVAS
jgi:signal transduction histidine kinase